MHRIFFEQCVRPPLWLTAQSHIFAKNHPNYKRYTLNDSKINPTTNLYIIYDTFVSYTPTLIHNT